MGLILSVFSLYLNEAPRVSLREEIHETDDSSESLPIEEDKWLPYINKECENFNKDDELTSPLPEFARPRLTNYRRIGDVSSELVSFWKSNFQKLLDKAKYNNRYCTSNCFYDGVHVFRFKDDKSWHRMAISQPQFTVVCKTFSIDW